MSLALGAFFIFFMSFVETKNVILSRDVDNRIENDARRQDRINLSMPGKYSFIWFDRAVTSRVN